MLFPPCVILDGPFERAKLARKEKLKFNCEFAVMTFVEPVFQGFPMTKSLFWFRYGSKLRAVMLLN